MSMTVLVIFIMIFVGYILLYIFDYLGVDIRYTKIR